MCSTARLLSVASVGGARVPQLSSFWRSSTTGDLWAHNIPFTIAESCTHAHTARCKRQAPSSGAEHCPTRRASFAATAYVTGATGTLSWLRARCRIYDSHTNVCESIC